MSDKEKVQEVVNDLRKEKSQVPLQKDDFVWTLLKDKHFSMLLDMIESPWTYKPSTAKSAKECLELSNANKPTTANNDSITYYIRHASFPKQDFLKAIQLYLDSFPADSIWANSLVESIKKVNSITISLFYAGLTSRTAYQRLCEDTNNIASRTRLYNWNQVNRTNWTAYTVKDLNMNQNMIDLDNVDDVKLVGYIEDILIKCVKNSSINSANGGKFVDWMPEETIMLTVDAFYKTLDAPQIKLDKLGFKSVNQEEIMLHFSCYYDFLKEIGVKQANEIHLKLPRKIADDAMIETEGGTVYLFKEITTSAMSRDLSFINDGDGFSSVFFRQTILPLINGMENRNKNDSSRTFVDLHPFTPEMNMNRAIPWASKYLKIIKPLVIVSGAQQIFSAFQQDLFHQCWKDPQGPNTQGFLKGSVVLHSKDDLNNLVSNKYKDNLKKFHYTDHVGQVSIVAFGPGDLDLSLLMPIRHPGNLRYM